MLAVVSPRIVSAAAPLLETDRSLWAQASARADQLQRDGWGLAWYEGRRPAVFKSPGPLAGQKGLLRRAASRSTGRRILFHLRRASNPRGLPLAKLRGRRNLQPFAFGRWTFAHNGTIPFPDETARRLGAFQKRLLGLNDSEVLFWTVMKELRRSGSVPAALKAVRRVLREVAGDQGDGSKPFHRGLNILLCDGRTFWAYCEPPAAGRATGPGANAFPSGGKGKPPEALASRGWPYWRLAYLPTPGAFWVASEPAWSGAPWRGMRPGELLEAREKAGEVVWKITKIAR